jgi:RNA recognition motif-containing protein
LVTFSEEASVDNLMSKRPHKIDGQFVELYRSVPDQGSLKEKKGIKNLIVSDVKKGLVSKLDLEKYFSKFGTIKNINMNYDENSCCIEFDE